MQMHYLQIYSTFTELNLVKLSTKHNSSSGSNKRSYLQINVFINTQSLRSLYDMKSAKLDSFNWS